MLAIFILILPRLSIQGNDRHARLFRARRGEVGASAETSATAEKAQPFLRV
jgi:hypothetical protein